MKERRKWEYEDIRKANNYTMSQTIDTLVASYCDICDLLERDNIELIYRAKRDATGGESFEDFKDRILDDFTYWYIKQCRLERIQRSIKK